MSDFIENLKALWVGNRQREFHNRTRGIVTPGDRRILEEEFDRLLSEVKAEVWREGFAHAVRTDFYSRMPRLEDNPYRKGETE